MQIRFTIYAIGIFLSFYNLSAQGELCNTSEKPVDEPAITLQQLSDLITTPDFYNSNHRYIDDLGYRGGRYSAGFIDTWLGETQIMFPYNGVPITVNLTNTTIAANSTNALYWMTLAMGQEYMNADMQWMMGVGAKETFSGTPLAGPPFNTNAEGAYGPFEVELFTGVDRAISYPTFYPEYQTLLENAQDIATSGITPLDFMNDYIGLDPVDPVTLDKATVVNGYIMSVGNFFNVYNWFSYAKDLCWHKVIDNPADRYYTLAAMTVTYNLGVFSADPIAETMNKDNYEATHTNPTARDLLPQGNSFYRKHITEVIESIVARSQEAMTNTSIPLWDHQIDWNTIERFFMGEGGTVTIQGKGGLFKHFHTNNTTRKQEIMTTLEDAFDILKGKAPSSSSTTISYRYDWLALLRTVKQHFSNEPIFVKPNAGDGSLRINAYSMVGGCCVETPEIIIDQACLDETTGFGLSLSVDTVAWEILDTNSSILFSSTDIFGNYDFTMAGNYTIQATITQTNPDTKEMITSVLTETIIFDQDPDSFDDRAAFQGNDIVVTPADTEGNIEYALDDIDGVYQNSTRFGNVTPETHTIFIKRNGCISSIEVSPDKEDDPNNPNNPNTPNDQLIIPEYFTPNGDGFHDTWHITDTTNTLLTVESRLYIFDRYGKLLTQLIPNQSGWDGFYSGKQMPSSEYWFTLEYLDNNNPKRIVGHFSLIR